MWLKIRKNGVTFSDYTVPLLQLSFRTLRRSDLFHLDYFVVFTAPMNNGRFVSVSRIR